MTFPRLSNTGFPKAPLCRLPSSCCVDSQFWLYQMVGHLLQRPNESVTLKWTMVIFMSKGPVPSKHCPSSVVRRLSSVVCRLLRSLMRHNGVKSQKLRYSRQNFAMLWTCVFELLMWTHLSSFKYSKYLTKSISLCVCVCVQSPVKSNFRRLIKVKMFTLSRHPSGTQDTSRSTQNNSKAKQKTETATEMRQEKMAHKSDSPDAVCQPKHSNNSQQVRVL